MLKERERGGPVSQLTFWSLGRKPKDNQEIFFDGVATKLSKYTTEFKNRKGEDADPYEEDIDKVAVVIAGHGKKHGHYMMLDGLLEDVPSLSQVQTCTSGSPSTHTRGQPRSTMAVLEVCSFSPFSSYSGCMFFHCCFYDINYMIL